MTPDVDMDSGRGRRGGADDSPRSPYDNDKVIDGEVADGPDGPRKKDSPRGPRGKGRGIRQMGSVAARALKSMGAKGVGKLALRLGSKALYGVPVLGQAVMAFDAAKFLWDASPLGGEGWSVSRAAKGYVGLPDDFSLSGEDADTGGTDSRRGGRRTKKGGGDDGGRSGTGGAPIDSITTARDKNGKLVVLSKEAAGGNSIGGPEAQKFRRSAVSVGAAPKLSEAKWAEGITGARTVLGQKTTSDSGSDSGGGTEGKPPNELVLAQKPVVEKVMKELGIDAKYLPGILKQMMQESGGNPKAINTWDSNAQAGTPSKGLMQTIPSTFEQFAPENMRDAEKYIFDPYANIYAGLNYAKSTYGVSRFEQWNAGNNVGYSQGTLRVTGDQYARIHANEMILPASIAENVRQALAKDSAGVREPATGILKVEVTLLNASEEEGRRLARVLQDELTNMQRRDELARR